MKKNGDLKVVKVYTQDGKQVAFDVQNATGTHRANKDMVVDAIKNGHSFVNATVTSSGVVRVDANVPRLPMQRDKLKVQAILYSPAVVKEGALGVLVKCDNKVKACTYDEFQSTVNNYGCDLEDRQAVVCFHPRESFKNGYKYFDISSKDFLKTSAYKRATPALKELVRSLSGNKTNTTKTNTTKTNIDTSLSPYFFKSDNMGFAGVCFSSALDKIKDDPVKYICNKPAKKIFFKTFELIEPYDKYFNEDLCVDKAKYIDHVNDYMKKYCHSHYPDGNLNIFWDSNFTSVPELISTFDEDGGPVYNFDGLIRTKFYVFKNSDVNPKEDTFDYQSYVLFAIKHLKTLIEWISNDSNLPTLLDSGRIVQYGCGGSECNYISLNNTHNCLDLNSPTSGTTFFRGYGIPITSYDNRPYLTFCDKNAYKKLLPLFKKLDEVLYKKQHK